MTVYAETSAVLRWLFNEEGGEALRQAIAQATKVTSSRLTLIETRRVIRRAERDGRITAAESADVLAIFAQAASTWAVLEVTEDVARRAEETFPNEPVRTLDAIHLATALVLSERQRIDLTFVTHDVQQSLAARALGFHCIGS